MRYRNLRGKANPQIISSWSKRNSRTQWVLEAQMRGAFTRSLLELPIPYHRFLSALVKTKAETVANRAVAAATLNYRIKELS